MKHVETTNNGDGEISYGITTVNMIECDTQIQPLFSWTLDKQLTFVHRHSVQSQNKTACYIAVLVGVPLDVTLASAPQFICLLARCVLYVFSYIWMAVKHL